MLIDLKYHLISIVAVFLALAVGILVGSSFIAGTSVKGLERQFVRLREENQLQRASIDTLRNDALKHEEFDSAVAPILVRNQLSGHRIAIIQTGDFSEATQSAKSILEQAGANVASVTTLSNLDAPDAQSRMARAIEQLTGETGVTDPVGRFLEILANSIASGSNPQSLGIFEQEDLLTTSGDYEHKVLRVVLIGGGKRRINLEPQHADLVLIDKLHAAGVVSVIGAEPADAVTSFIPMYHRKSIPTVDNVDQPMGQVALVYAVAGENGNFGVKPSADRVVPSSLGSLQWHNASAP